MRIVSILLISFTLMFSVNLNPQQLALAKAAGYSESDIKKQISSDDDQKTVEKKEQIVTNDIQTNILENENSKKMENEKDKKENQTFDNIKVSKFGSLFFNNKNKLNPYSIPTPSNYKLNHSDKISLVIYGAQNQEFDLSINKNGNILIPRVGELKVIGLTFSEAKKLISEESNKAYPNNTNILVDMTEYSSIQVTISGLVNTPGLYNLSSFSTIKDALISSGGILENGSYRNIFLKRNGKVKKIFDLYQLVRYGDVSVDALLQSGDVILVKPISKRIRLSGNINYNADFELKDNEGFKNLIDFAAGFKANANKNAIKLKRYENNSIKVYTLSLNKLLKLKPKDGDSVHVYGTSTIGANLIKIIGNIVVEGEKEFPKDNKLSTLLDMELKQFGNNSYFKDDTNYSFAIVKNDNNIKTFNLQNVLEKKEDLKLEKGDVITIFKNQELKNKPYVLVSGSLIDENKNKYDYFDGLEVRDLFEMVQFTNENLVSKSKVQITRIENNTKKTFLINTKSNKNFKLMKYDDIKFFSYSELNDEYKVTIKGEVFIPGTYDIHNETSVNDIIRLSGGFTKKALKTRFEIARYEIKGNKRVRSIHTLDINEAMAKEIKVLADDEITIFSIANWNDKLYVEVRGEVRFPGVYPIETGEKLSNVIQRAGGYLNNAFVEGAVFTREEIKVLQQKRLDESLAKLNEKVTQSSLSVADAGESSEDKIKMIETVKLLEKEAKNNAPIGRISLELYHDLQRFENSEYNINLKDGDKLFIPSINDTVSVVGEVLNPSTFVYKKDLEVEDYLNKTGNISETADDDYIYIVKANGETVKYETKYFFGYSNEIFKGDTIVVPLKVDSFSDMKFAKDVSTILYQFAITAASLKTVGGI